MSMDQPDTIDFIVAPSEKSDNKLLMVIADANNVPTVDDREKAFIKKLTYYFNVATSESFKEKYPNIDLQDIIIQVHSILPPTENMLKINSVSYPGESQDATKRIPIGFCRTDGRPW